MPKDNTKQFVKIGEASEKLGVSIDTLRRWEKAGKIEVIRTPGGTRLYAISTLKELISAPLKYRKSVESISLPRTLLGGTNKPQLSTVEELLQHLEVIDREVQTESGENDIFIDARIPEPEELSVYAEAEIPEDFSTSEESKPTPEVSRVINHKSLIINRFQAFTAFSGLFACLIITFLILARINLITPKSSESIAKIEDFKSQSGVLAAETAGYYLNIKSDVAIEGDLAVGGMVNGLTLTPNADGFTLAGGTSASRKLTVLNGDVTLDQDVSTKASPSFVDLKLTATTKQINMGGAGTLTWTPTGTQVITFPNATGNVVLDTASQTITNKTINGSSNTLSSISNSSLSNHAVTVTAGTNLSGGGDIELGSSATLSLKGDISLTSIVATGDIKAATFTGTSYLTLSQTTAPSTTTNKLYNVSGALLWNGVNLSSGGALPVGTTGQTMYHNGTAWTATSNLFHDGTNVGIGTALPGGKLGVAGGVSIGSYSDTAPPGNGLIVSGNVGFGTSSPLGALDVLSGVLFVPSAGTNVGIGTTAPLSKLGVLGNGAIGSTYGNLSAPANGLIVQGRVGIGTTSPQAPFHVSGESGEDVVRFTTGAGNWDNLQLQLSDAALSSSNVRFAHSLRTGGAAYLLYGYDGTTFKNFQAFNYPNNTVYFTSAGVDSNAPASSTLTVDLTGGNVGIGTTSPSQVLDVVGNANISSGSTYKIAGTDVLSGTVLGSGVVTSSLTTVGALASGSIATGFGNISTGNTITTTGTMGTAATTTFTGATGTFSTSTTSPLILGGTAVGSSLTLQSTSGVGTTDFIKFAVGNNGATEAVRITNAGNVGIGTTAPAYKLDIATSTASDRGINIANTAATGTNYGIYSSVTGASTANIGGYFQATGATTSRGLEVAAMTSATSTGLTIGALSGTTADTGINIGAISGTGATGTGITIGNISTTGTTNYGLLLGTMAGGTTSNYQISTGVLTSATTTTNAQLNLGGVVTTGGTTNYGINVGALSGTGTTNYGVNINTLTSVGTTNYGLNIGGATGAATTNYGLLIGAVSGASANNYGLYTTSGTTVLNATSGNVGIGTTSPLGLLHVAGQCVAKGTRIRRRRRKWLSGLSDQFSDDSLPDDQLTGLQTTDKQNSDNRKQKTDNWIWIEEDIPVEDIRSDDEVLSLNEKTGEFEWRKVEKTLNKGKQTSIKLITQSGKWIETTSEHPYLVIVKNSHQKTASTAVLVSQTSLLNDWLDNLKSSIQQNISFVKPEIIMGVDLPGVEPGRLGLSSQSSKPAKPTPLLLSQIATKWVKVSQLKKGMKIATVSGFEKIISIKKTNRKQMYDLQIEGTHNFIGNDIVAHNTAIFGAGEGSTPTVTTLRGAAASGTDIAGANFTFDASNGTGTGGSGALIFRTAPTAASSSTANTLAEIMRITPGGNIGIGTTGPDSKVDSLATSGSQFRATYTDGSVYTDMTTDSSGNFKLNNTGGTYTLGRTTAGTVSLTAGDDDSTAALSIDSGGTGDLSIGTGANAKTITIGNATTSTALAFNSGTGSQTFTSQVVSGTTTTSAFVFDATAITTGTGAYFTSDSITQGKLVDINTGSSNTLTSGTLLNIASTATSLTSGSLLSLDWSPGSSTTATGDLFSLNIGANGLMTGNLFNIKDNSSSIFSVSQTAVTASIPTNFTAPGDVSMANDLNFTNPAASYIKSQAPLYMTAGEIANSSNLTLQTYNQGSIVLSSAVTTGTAVDIQNTGLTTGYGLSFTGPSSTGITGSALYAVSDIGSSGKLVSLAPDFSGSAVTGYGVYNTGTDSTSGANTDYGYYGSLALTGNAAKTGYGIYSTITTSSTTADTLYSLYTATSATGIISSGTRANYGAYFAPASTGANTGGTQNLYGIYSTPSSTLAAGSTENVYGGYFKATGTLASGTVNSYGLYVANPTMNTTGTSTKYGLYIEDVTAGAADYNYAAVFAGGNVGIGTTTPAYKLDIATSTASDRGINIANTAATGTNYGIYSSVTGSATANIGGYFVSTGATTSRGLEVAAMTSATSTGLTIGALSGTTADTGINIGAISGTGATGTGITIGNISTTGTTNYGLLLGTMTGGTTSNYQISTGILTSATTTTNAQLNLGGVVTTGGTTNYGINVGALSGTGTTNYGVNINTLTSVGTTNYGLLIGAVSGASANNYGLYTTSGTTVLNATSGNVGIGTTSPLGLLHVAGQCVTGDTLLKRRRRRKKSHFGSDEPPRDKEDDEWLATRSLDEVWEDVRIDEIEPGDEILTLDEKTGKFVVSKVKALQNMGIHQTYLLITDSGKTIRTTTNHPYLVKNSHQKTASTAVLVSQTSLLNDWIDTLKSSIHHNLDFVKSENIMGVDLPGVEPGRLGVSTQSSKPAKPTPNVLSQNANLFSTKWIKISQLKKGMEIATLDGWEKIAAIKEFTREQVFDIEVEGTHNFVGNDIVAHNTAIFGAGEGSTPTVTTLRGAAASGTDIAGANFTFDASNGTGTGGSGALIFRTAPTTASSSTANTLAEIMRITPGGNVGIGTTGPGTKLEIAHQSASPQLILNRNNTTGSSFMQFKNTGGTWNIGLNAGLSYNPFVVSDGTTNHMVVQTTGNVGIGTTSPLGLLHVAGQCVAKGTRIRRKKKSSSDGGDEGDSSEVEWEEIPVEDIKPGDEILSLNDKTGEFEWRKVEKTLDKGTQTSVLLVTETGKNIETTWEHPYFTQNAPKPKKFGGSFEIDQSGRIEDLAKNTYISIANKHHQFTIKISASEKKKLYQIHQAKRYSKFGFQVFAQIINLMLEKASFMPANLTIDLEYPGYHKEIEQLILVKFPNLNIIFESIGRSSPAHLEVYEAYLGKRKFDLEIINLEQKNKAEISRENIESVTPGVNTWIRSSHGLTNDLYHKTLNLSIEKGQWLKVSQIKPGMVVATINGWEKIVLIKEIGRKQMYDLQIEDTHNFVGNDIVAHNTAIFGAGEGSTPTVTTLRGAAASGTDIAGANFTFDASNGTGTGGSGALIFRTAPTAASSSTANTLAEIMRITPGGNVGIGTTSPGAKLHIEAGSILGKTTTDVNYTINSAGMLGSLGATYYFGNDAGPAGIKANNTEYVTVTTSGNVGIGTTLPSYALDVKASGTGIIARFNNDNSSGCTLADGGTISCTSDVNLKKNIEDINYGLSDLMSLKPIVYNWKSDSDQTAKNLGFIAQDVEQIIPKLVATDISTGLKSLNTIGLIPVLTKSIQELNQKISLMENSYKIDANGKLVIPEAKIDKLIISGDVDLGSNATFQVGFDSWKVSDLALQISQMDSRLTRNDNAIAELDSRLRGNDIALDSLRAEIASMSSQLSDLSYQSSASSSSVISQSASSSSATEQQTTDQLLSDNGQQKTDNSLNLTPPEILLSTESASLIINRESLIVSDATISGKLTSYDLSVQNNFKSLGEAFLGNTTVAGNFSVDGTMLISGNSISTLGILYIQNSPLAQGIDFFNGQVTIDKTGKLVAQEIVAKIVTTEKLVIKNTPGVSPGSPGVDSIGEAIIPAGQTEIPVFSNAVTDKSRIFLTPLSSTAGQAPFVSAVVANTGFVVKLDHAVTFDIKFNWLLIDSQ